MREILFRGKRPYTGEWAKGNLNVVRKGSNTYAFISNAAAGSFEVIPETVGQFTGLVDRNGKRIFEGDIVSIKGVFTGYVVFCEGCFQALSLEEDVFEVLWYQPEEMTVLGNIHDNPELWKDGE